MTASIPQPKGRVRHYEHPPLYRHLSVVGIAVCAVTAASMLALPVFRPGQGNWFLIVSSFASLAVSVWIGLRMARRSRDSVVVTDDGIGCHSPDKPELFIRWDEVAEVESQNVMQRLVVSDAAGARRIPLEFHLQNFGELRRIVLEHARTTGARIVSGT